MVSLDRGVTASQTSSQRHTTDRSIRYNQPAYRAGKRMFDIVGSLVLIILLLPVLVLITLLIALQDGFPVVFKQRRLGTRGRVFYIYKFRTMVKNAEEILRSRPDLMEEYRLHYKIHNDPRISKLGNFLRRTSLDELPQLFNVLRGEMSLVGPRPIVEPELAMYGDAREVYLAMKPGCAGLWQCSGRSETSYEKRVELDREYYLRSSLRYDVGVLGKTFVAVVLRRGAL
jgi:exopolysaccharide production protein ExoY